MGQAGRPNVSGQSTQRLSLTGGDGNDRFLFTDDGTAQTDTITDFTHGQDLIVLINHPSPVAATTFAYVASHATQTGADLSLAIDPTHTLLLKTTTLAQGRPGGETPSPKSL